MNKQTDTYFSLIIAIYFIFAVFRYAVSLLMPEPFIMQDELIYKAMAFALHKGKKISDFHLGVPLDLPNFLYQYLISFSFYFGHNFYAVIKLINSLLMNMAVFPVYFLCREFADGPKSLMACAVSMLLPSMSYVNNVMPENLYLPLFLTAFYFSYKYLITYTFLNGLLSGTLFVLLFFTKPHAVALVITFIIMFAFSLFFQEKSGMKKTVISALSAGVLSLVLFGLIRYSYAENISSSDSFLGIYQDAVSTKPATVPDMGKMFQVLMGHLSLFLFVYLLPCTVLILSAFDCRKDRKVFLFLLYGTLLFSALLTMVLKLTADVAGGEEYLIVHARYYFVAYPFFIITFFCFNDKIKLGRTGSMALLLSFFVITFLMLKITYPLYIYSKWSPGALIAGNIEATWLNVYGKKIFIAVCLGYFIGIILYLLKKKISTIVFAALFSVLACFANIAQIKCLIQYQNSFADHFRNARNFIQINIPSSDAKIVLVGSSFDLRMNIPFWLPYDYPEIYQYEKGESVGKAMIPPDSEYIVLLDDYHIDFPVQSSESRNGVTITKIR